MKVNYSERKSVEVQELLHINVYTIDSEEQSSTILNVQLISSQLLTHVLLRTKPTLNDKDELIDICKKE